MYIRRPNVFYSSTMENSSSSSHEETFLKIKKKLLRDNPSNGRSRAKTIESWEQSVLVPAENIESITNISKKEDNVPPATLSTALYKKRPARKIEKAVTVKRKRRPAKKSKKTKKTVRVNKKHSRRPRKRTLESIS